MVDTSLIHEVKLRPAANGVVEVYTESGEKEIIYGHIGVQDITDNFIFSYTQIGKKLMTSDEKKVFERHLHHLLTRSL